MIHDKVLISGGAGFIGSFLCERFLREGWEVLCVDNLFTGRKANIRHLFADPNFEFIRHDIIDKINVQTSLILNFACPASPVHYQYDPLKTIKTSFCGTMNLLELARETKATFLQASTSEVYGDPLVHPQREDYWGNVNPIGIRSCYDEGKRAAETLCFDYRRLYGMDTRIVRIFNTYGPRMAANDGRVVSNFIVQALKGDDLTIYGDGSQTRSFCFVSDLVEGIYRAATRPGIIGPINLGNDREFTVLELARLILEKVTTHSKLHYCDLPGDDPKIRCPDISRARTQLDWGPKVLLETGLDQAITYFKSELTS
jgi:UDP-glucuronate decarboxylase